MFRQTYCSQSFVRQLFTPTDYLHTCRRYLFKQTCYPNTCRRHIQPIRSSSLRGFSLYTCLSMILNPYFDLSGKSGISGNLVLTVFSSSSISSMALFSCSSSPAYSLAASFTTTTSGSTPWPSMIHFLPSAA